VHEVGRAPFGEESRAIRDVVAQENMATYALYMAAISLIGTIASISALVGLFKSLSHTREAIQNDRAIARAQLSVCFLRSRIVGVEQSIHRVSGISALDELRSNTGIGV
jgi:hypothetical protein